MEQISDSCDLKKGRRGGARTGAGQPSFEPYPEERALVEQLSGRGVPIKSISTMIRDGISDNTLSKHFARELAVGKAKACAEVAGKLFEMAIGGNVTACIFWCKTQMGWKEESQQVELSGPGGSPLVIEKLWGNK
ncbi:MAG: hypothetical protein H7829_01350 [Magnetococcus sp. THC-1_WYH]